MSSFEEILQKGSLVCPTKGVSMQPLFKEGRDRVVVVKCDVLKKNDVALFRRGEECVLHRVVKVKKGCYDFLGDNSLNKDFSIPSENVLGKVVGYFKGEKYKKSLKNPFYLVFIKTRYLARKFLRKLKKLFRKNKYN